MSYSTMYSKLRRGASHGAYLDQKSGISFLAYLPPFGFGCSRLNLRGPILRFIPAYISILLLPCFSRSWLSKVTHMPDPKVPTNLQAQFEPKRKNDFRGSLLVRCFSAACLVCSFIWTIYPRQNSRLLGIPRGSR